MTLYCTYIKKVLLLSYRTSTAPNSNIYYEGVLMDYRIIYYVQINIISIVVLLLILFRGIRFNKESSVQTKTLRTLVIAACFLCISDMLAAVFRGQTFAGAAACVEIINMCYLALGVFISYKWLIYVLYELGEINKRRTPLCIACTVPFALFMILLLINPLTGLMFEITPENTYVRGPLIAAHVIVCFLYMIIAEIKVIAASRRETNRLRKAEIRPLLYFAVPAMLGGIIQSVCYGVTIFQIGITVAILLLYETRQASVIHTDALTKLNNRRALDEYIEGMVKSGEKRTMTFVMLDINKFKMINDNCGHLVGDEVLRSVSFVLKRSCSVVESRLFICRYGGDEFLIAGSNLSESEIASVTSAVDVNVKKLSDEFDIGFDFSASIGEATGICRNYDEAVELISVADIRMYENKKQNRT